MKRSFFGRCFPAILVLSGTVGCTNQQAQPPPVPEVTIRPAIEQDVTDSAEFPGRTEAVASVEIRARVTGYLDKINFQPGADVKEGDVLFQIDPLLFQAELERAEGQVAVQEADAAVKAARANLKGYQQNLKYATIKAPISGKISRSPITEGNLVKADSSVLATLVSEGVIYAYFDVDENALLRYEAEVRQRKLEGGGLKEGLVEITLGDGSVFKGGTIDYKSPEVDKKTGTLEVRARFPDPGKIMRSGQFVRVWLPIGNPHKAVLVPEIAVGSDQGLKYVFVVGADDKVEYRRVTVGKVQKGMQLIQDGLEAGEWVITKGLLRVRDGVTVKPTREEAKKPDAK